MGVSARCLSSFGLLSGVPSALAKSCWDAILENVEEGLSGDAARVCALTCTGLASTMGVAVCNLV